MRLTRFEEFLSRIDKEFKIPPASSDAFQEPAPSVDDILTDWTDCLAEMSQAGFDTSGLKTELACLIPGYFRKRNRHDKENRSKDTFVAPV